MTGPEKTALIYTKYTYSYYDAHLFFSVCATLILLNSLKFVLEYYVYLKD